MEMECVVSTDLSDTCAWELLVPIEGLSHCQSRLGSRFERISVGLVMMPSTAH